MSFLILIRHGQSTWNLEKRFTGWVDVDLTENGKLEAKKAGELIKKTNIKIDAYYSSLQLRAKNTLNIIQKIFIVRCNRGTCKFSSKSIVYATTGSECIERSTDVAALHRPFCD